jgi:hypothetical protein
VRRRRAIVLFALPCCLGFIGCTKFDAADPPTTHAGGGETDGTTSEASDGGAIRTTKLVFVTFGRIKSGGGGDAMRARADGLCNTEASSVGTPGTFVAWLSTPKATARPADDDGDGHAVDELRDGAVRSCARPRLFRKVNRHPTRRSTVFSVVSVVSVALGTRP